MHSICSTRFPYKKSLKNLCSHFNIYFIIKSFFIAFCFSFFIYLSYIFNVSSPILELFFSFLGFYLLLKEKKRSFYLLSGFFIGVMWFYWAPFGIKYYGIPYLIMPAIVAIAFIIGLMLYAISFLKYPTLKALGFLFISYVHPFGFNWFIPELTLINTPIGVNKLYFALFLASIVCLIELRKYYRTLFIIPLLLSINYSKGEILPLPNVKIYLSDTDISQSKKWGLKYKKEIINQNFKIINRAIKRHYDVVVLSETAFPLVLNKNPYLLDRLKNKSKQIDIITGSVYDNANGNYYNASYFFKDGHYYVATKVVLAPFGEYIPMPKFIKKLINSLTSIEIPNFSRAKKPTDFNIEGINFRNAICYEATTNELYQKNVKYLIAISNNAWFKPSIEPTLQYLLLKYFSKKYKTVIYHSANGGITKIIR